MVLNTFSARILCRQPINGLFAAFGPGVEILQIRGRKRGSRQLTRAERLKRRQIREEKLANKKTFMQRVQEGKIKAARGAVSWPPRYDAEKEKHLPDAQPNGVYFIHNTKTHFYSIAEALAMHRRLQSPAMYGNADAPLKLRMELNMDTDKASKFTGASRQLVPVPFPFKYKEKRTILAFAPTKEAQDEALVNGADLALGADAVKKILKGKFIIDDYDFCIAHQDMVSAIAPLRGILKTRFPTKLNGGIGTDLAEILKNFLTAVSVVVKPNLAYPQWGLCEPIIGKLDMADEQIEANIETIVTQICQLRNAALGPFINRALIMTVPGKHFCSIDVSAWMPVATEADKEKLEKRKKKKKKKAEKAKDDGLDEETIAAMKEKRTHRNWMLKLM